MCKTSAFPHQSNFKNLSRENFFFPTLKNILKKTNEKLLNLFALKSYEAGEIYLRIEDTKKKNFNFQKKFWLEFQKKNLKKNWDKDIKNLKEKTDLVLIFNKKKKAVNTCNKKIKISRQDKKQEGIKKTRTFIGEFRTIT